MMTPAHPAGVRWEILSMSRRLGPGTVSRTNPGELDQSQAAKRERGRRRLHRHEHPGTICTFASTDEEQTGEPPATQGGESRGAGARAAFCDNELIDPTLITDRECKGPRHSAMCACAALSLHATLLGSPDS